MYNPNHWNLDAKIAYNSEFRMLSSELIQIISRNTPLVPCYTFSGDWNK